MKTETKEIYKCDHCNKLYQVKNACALHEIRCYHNPDNKRPCMGCDNLVKREITHSYWDDREYEVLLSVFYCRAKEIYLYPPKAEFKKNQLDFGEINEPMPKECSEFKALDII